MPGFLESVSFNNNWHKSNRTFLMSARKHVQVIGPYKTTSEQLPGNQGYLFQRKIQVLIFA